MDQTLINRLVLLVYSRFAEVNCQLMAVKQTLLLAEKFHNQDRDSDVPLDEIADIESFSAIPTCAMALEQVAAENWRRLPHAVFAQPLLREG